MGNLTRKQKKNIRDLVTGVVGCMVISLILIINSLLNRHEYVPVVFSDILDGATVTAGTEFEENSEISLENDYLYERLFESETIILTTTAVNDYSQATTVPAEIDYDEPQGAGGTLLINTTEITAPPDTDEETKTTTETTETEATSSESETTVKTTSSTTTSAITTTTVKKTTTTPKRTTIAKKTTKAETSSTSKTPFTNVGGGVISQDDDVYIGMLNLVNKAREENGLEKLWYSARVHEIATLRAYELSSYYSHNRSDGRGFNSAYTDAGIKYKIVGENIAYGRNMFKNVEDVFNAWMDSPSHRENILNPDYECVGFGLSVLKVGKDTYYYWSQEFATFK